MKVMKKWLSTDRRSGNRREKKILNEVHGEAGKGERKRERRKDKKLTWYRKCHSALIRPPRRTEAATSQTFNHRVAYPGARKHQLQRIVAENFEGVGAVGEELVDVKRYVCCLVEMNSVELMKGRDRCR